MYISSALAQSVDLNHQLLFLSAYSLSEPGTNMKNNTPNVYCKEQTDHYTEEEKKYSKDSNLERNRLQLLTHENGSNLKKHLSWFQLG